MARRISRKELKQDEFVDAVFDFGHWIEKHWMSVLRWGALVAVLAVMVLAWAAYARHGRAQAEVRLSAALRTFDELEADGFADTAQLDELLVELDGVADDAGGSAASVARLYRGSALFRLERYEEAEDELKSAISGTDDDSTLYGTANSLLANVYQAAGRTDEAIEVLNGLLDDPRVSVPADQTLLRIGQIYDEAGRVEEAREQWQRVLDEYANGAAAAEARQLLNS